MLGRLIPRFEVNVNIVSTYIKLVALLTDCKEPSQVAKIGKILLRYAYSDQKELVRVATVKSMRGILCRFDLSMHSTSCLDVYMSLVLLANDEHPEIRTYLLQSRGVSQLVDRQVYSIESQSLASHKSDEGAAIASAGEAMVIDLNEQVMVESILKTALAWAKSEDE